jgi:hypothetical protein
MAAGSADGGEIYGPLECPQQIENDSGWNYDGHFTAGLIWQRCTDKPDARNLGRSKPDTTRFYYRRACVEDRGATVPTDCGVLQQQDQSSILAL